MTRALTGLGRIVGRFDAVLVDQFGVLHDGRAPFPLALRCLERLREHGTPVVALTNSGKRADSNLARLARLGFAPELFKGLISSGELARDELALRLADGRLRPGAAIAVLSRDGDASPLDGLDLRSAPPGPDTALVLIAGAEPETTPLDRYMDALAPLAARGVPAICANPDTAIYVGGASGFGPGVIAARYGALGPEVLWLGKPAEAMFRAALAALAAPDPSRVLMIGDGLAHDIRGAARAGCRTLLVRSGVQADQSSDGPSADYEMERLVW